jgi:hypothetical protein
VACHLSDRIDQIAALCHEANRIYCESYGDTSQSSWTDAEEQQRLSVRAGVIHALKNPNITQAESHENWLSVKRETGWSFGPTKDPARMKHPCFLPYHQLPLQQRYKAKLFLTIVLSCKEMFE